MVDWSLFLFRRLVNTNRTTAKQHMIVNVSSHKEREGIALVTARNDRGLPAWPISFRIKKKGPRLLFSFYDPSALFVFML